VADVAARPLAAGVAAASGVSPRGDRTARQVLTGDTTTPVATTPQAFAASPGAPQPAPTATIAGSRGQQGSSVVATGAGPKIYDVGVSDAEIRIGGSTFTSGPAAVYGEQIAVGFAAGVQYINDHGGINGRKVVLKLYDDAGDPARQLTNTKRLIEVDKVFALSMIYAPIAGA